jgi:hypothetical protein
VCSYPFPNNYWRNNNGTLTISLDTFPKDTKGQGINVNAGGWNELGEIATAGRA